jgi:hypothetical protein
MVMQGLETLSAEQQREFESLFKVNDKRHSLRLQRQKRAAARELARQQSAKESDAVQHAQVRHCFPLQKEMIISIAGKETVSRTF